MKVVFQGVLGAYSHLASSKVYPDAEYIGCETFAKVLELVTDGIADRAVVPIENSKAGRVADLHFLLPGTGLYIIGEYYLPIHHQLWGLPGTKLENITEAYSHPQALAQCAGFLSRYNIRPFSAIDTALSCKQILDMNDKSIAAIASEKAGQIYGLQKLAENIEDSAKNTTRFLIMSRQTESYQTQNCNQKFKTSLIFRTKNIPSALFRALACFADENLNLTKIESYLVDEEFIMAQFYVEVEANAESKEFKRAQQQLARICDDIHILGTYLAGV